MSTRKMQRGRWLSVEERKLLLGLVTQLISTMEGGLLSTRPDAPEAAAQMYKTALLARDWLRQTTGTENR